MKQTHFIGGALLVLILIGSACFVLLREKQKSDTVACPMDAKICSDGNTVGRVGPNCEFAPCPVLEPVPEPAVQTSTTSDPVGEAIAAHAELIVVDTPLRDATITPPVTITGKARGTWYFESIFPIVIVDWDGKIIGEGYGEAQDNWMTEDFVPFTTTVDFTVATGTPYRHGSLILRKDNPSGLPERDDALEIPIAF